MTKKIHEDSPRAEISNKSSIQEILMNIKHLFHTSDFTIAVIIVLVSGTSFLLGRLSASEEHAATLHFEDTESASAQQAVVNTSLLNQFESSTVSILQTKQTTKNEGSSTSTVASVEGGYVVSKRGTKYHLPWCPGAQTIKEENKMWFATKEEAEAAGYTPAGNCKGI